MGKRKLILTVEEAEKRIKKAKKKASKIAYIVSISGGKDSVTMADLLLKNRFPVDYIVAMDTTIDFPETKDFLNKLDNYFYNTYGKRITFLKPREDYKNILLTKAQNGENKGKIYGFEAPNKSICKVLTKNKRDVFRAFKKALKNMGYEGFYVYVGYTADEAKRSTSKSNFEDRHTKIVAPLITIFNMTEKDCMEYIKRNPALFNPLYKHFHRTGCMYCHKQNINSWFVFYQNYYKYWLNLKKYEKIVFKAAEKEQVVNPYLFRNNKTTEDVEKEEFVRIEEKILEKKLVDCEYKNDPIIKEFAHNYLWYKRQEQIANELYSKKKWDKRMNLLKNFLKGEINLKEEDCEFLEETKETIQYTFIKNLIKELEKEPVFKKVMNKIDNITIADLEEGKIDSLNKSA